MTMQELQESFYESHGDYQSAHLRHPQLKSRLSDLLITAYQDLDARGLSLTTLEVGAGHGGYTEVALALGGEVTAVEMSRTALHDLCEKYRTNPRLHGVFDADGSLSNVEGEFSLVLAVSVLHHIPDYLAFLDVVRDRLAPGGSILAIQDPLWYPRVPAVQHKGERAAYLTWRLGRGDLRQGFASLGRRIEKKYDESNARDMIEYHVVRDGVDELAIQEQLAPHFESVGIVKYWSTPAPLAQWAGERLHWANTFAFLASGYRG